MADNKRNYGIDLLRIVSMVMVCVLHVLNHGGVLEACVKDGVGTKVACTSLLKAAVMCSVNCYAMISGYVGYESKHKLSNIIYLTLQTTFYSVLITGAFFLIQHGGEKTVGIGELGKAFFPGIYGQYWYFTSYFIMFFFIPLLNAAAEKMEEGLFKKTLFILFIMFSVLPTLFHADPADTKLGFSTLWLMVMYLFGAYLKKYDPMHNFSNSKKFLLYLTCVLVAWMVKLVIEFSSLVLLGINLDIGGEILYEYTSPTTVVCAISLVSLFASLKLRDCVIRFVKFFAPVSFGVYLGHELKILREVILVDRFYGYADLNLFLLIPLVLITALAWWFVFSMIDKLRLMLFNALKIRRFCENLGDKVDVINNRILKID